jgi:hypothetical protein
VKTYARTPGSRKRDREGSRRDRAGLADELVEPRLVHRAGAVLVDVAAVRRTGRPAVEADGEAHAGACGGGQGRG